MELTRQTLDANWQVREVPPARVPPHNHLPWLPAQVPGHVHLDLMRAGVIPDPFVRMHERAVAWVDESDWVYETTFTVDDPVPAHAYLVFNGLDTVAEIMLNGEELGRTDNMYIPHEFPVGGRLQAGENHLQVLFRSALRVGRERQEAWHAREGATGVHWDAWDARSFVRKAQYMFGWDWGPVLRSCGLWRPVELVTVPVARLLDCKYDYTFVEENTIRVIVTAEVERLTVTDAPLTLHAFLDKKGGVKGDISVPNEPGIHTLTLTLPDAAIRRWQVNGVDGASPYGIATENEQAVYSLQVELTAGQGANRTVLHKVIRACGFRTLELVREPDADGQGEGFKFRVNGSDVFVKGANWIPNSSYPSQTFDDWPEAMRERLRQAQNAGFNMVRIWGGGLYENDAFYGICDELGLLVWQDFPHACAYYPDTGEYAEAAKREATAAVRRIRSHPSLALWCGNNENDQMYHDNWTGDKPPRYLGDKLYREIYPAIVQAEDPKTPYWPSSPSGGDNPNSEDFGDCHNWDVWHGRGDWKHYTDNDSRFCSEFGFASSCSLTTWDKVLAPGDKHPLSPVVRWHDKTRKGYDTYLGMIGLHYPDAQTLEDLVYFSQINQAEALKYGIEHYRRRKGRCWGTLFWQLNDCWPVQSWAIIDSEGQPKAAWYWAKKFYAPVLLSLYQQEGQIEAHLVSDLLRPLSGKLTLRVETFEGETVLSQTVDASVDANSAAQVFSLDARALAGQEREQYVYARFEAEDRTIAAENILLLAEPKDLRLPDPGLMVTVTEGDWAFVVTLTARRFAPYVWLRLRDNAPLCLWIGGDDNFFHLRAGETRDVVVGGSETIRTVEDLRGRLVARTL